MPARPVTDYAHFLSAHGAARTPSPIHVLLSQTFPAGTISLAGGMPHPSTFPFTSVNFSVASGESIEVPADHLRWGLNYSATEGFSNLLDWLRALQVQEHRRDAEAFDICIGVGSQDLLCKAIDSFVSDGDSVLIESPAYAGTLAFMRPLGVEFVEVPVDSHGLDADAMERVLAEWPAGKQRPKLIYTVPTSGNPTGVTTTLERKKAVYEVASKYNIIILEDDPYYYLQFRDERDPSYFALDVDGRVLRFDSLSKIVSAGMRLGWVSGPKQLVDPITIHGMASNLQPSGLMQVMINALFQKWGIPGFLAHTRSVAGFYRSKRDIFVAAARRHLDGIAEFTVPSAGMFVWLKLIGVEDTTELIKRKAIDKRVLLVPGSDFMPNPRPTPFVRASYSMASEQDIDLALQRLREVVLESTALGPVKVDPALAAHNTVPLQPSGVPIQPLPDLVGIPVHVAEPRPDAVLGHDSAGPHGVLAHPALVITRQLEMMNVLIGYEQANKYAIKDPAGNDVGFIAEEETSISGTVLRQLMRTRRAFKAVVLDRNGAVVLKIDRPVKWLLNSTITIRDGDDNIIGEAKQVWHLWRRKYDLFLGKRQFAIIDGGFWAWDFELRDESDGLLGSVNRNFVGFAREIFTDTGQYAVHMDSTPNLARPLSLDERAVMLATAISIDIDYFSRHSSSGGGIMPLPFFGMGGHGGSDVPATVPGGDVAPIPSGGGGGGMMPPVFIPGVGVGGGAGSSPAPPVPPSGAPPADAAPGGTDAVPNQWGETPFLTDEQAGISSGDSGLSLNDVWKWLSDD